MDRCPYMDLIVEAIGHGRLPTDIPELAKHLRTCDECRFRLARMNWIAVVLGEVGLRELPPPAEEHLSDLEIGAFACGGELGDRLDALERHVSVCAECATETAEIRSRLDEAEEVLGERGGGSGGPSSLWKYVRDLLGRGSSSPGRGILLVLAGTLYLGQSMFLGLAWSVAAAWSLLGPDAASPLPASAGSESLWSAAIMLTAVLGGLMARRLSSGLHSRIMGARLSYVSRSLALRLRLADLCATASLAVFVGVLTLSWLMSLGAPAAHAVAVIPRVAAQAVGVPLTMVDGFSFLAPLCDDVASGSAITDDLIVEIARLVKGFPEADPVAAVIPELRDGIHMVDLPTEGMYGPHTISVLRDSDGACYGYVDVDLSSGQATRTYDGADVPLEAGRLPVRFHIAPGVLPRLRGGIAFESNRERLGEGLYDLYLTSPSGAELRQLTHTHWRNVGPAWSPDGRRIAFSSDRHSPGRDQHDIYVLHLARVDADGYPVVRRITEEIPVGPDGRRLNLIHVEWAPGPRITCTHGQGDIAPFNIPMIVEPDAVDPSSNAKYLYTSRSNAMSGSLDAEGRWALFMPWVWTENQIDIYERDTTGLGERPLVELPGLDTCPEWSPDGTRLAFTNHPDEYGDVLPDIWIRESDGSLVRVSSDPRHEEDPTWSPDATRLAFWRVAPAGAQSHIVVRDLATGSETQLTSADDAYNYSPVWQPATGRERHGGTHDDGSHEQLTVAEGG